MIESLIRISEISNPALFLVLIYEIHFLCQSTTIYQCL